MRGSQRDSAARHGLHLRVPIALHTDKNSMGSCSSSTWRPDVTCSHQDASLVHFLLPFFFFPAALFAFASFFAADDDAGADPEAKPLVDAGLLAGGAALGLGAAVRGFGAGAAGAS